MFAAKVLKYAVRSTSPVCNIVPQESGIYCLKPKYTSTQIPTTLVKDETSIRNQEDFRPKSGNSSRNRCTVSGPQHNLSAFQRTIIDHPNIEKAATLVHLIEDQVFGKRKPPHHIGSMPNGHIDYEKHQQQAKKLKILENLTSKAVNFNPSDDNSKSDNDVKPYVINIYLESKRSQPPQNVVDFDETSIRNKIKEFWEESVREEEEERIRAEEAYKAADNTENIEDVDREDGKRMKRAQENFVKVEDTVEDGKRLPLVEYSDIAKRQDCVEDENIQGEKKEIEETNIQGERKEMKETNIQGERKEMEEVDHVTPVKTHGFAKYLTYWKQMFAARTDEVEIDEREPKESGRRTFETIENERVFNPSSVVQKMNPYDPRLKEKEEQMAGVAEVAAPKQMINQNQRSHYGTKSCTNEILGGKPKGTTHVRISEFENVEGQNVRDYSTLCQLNVKCDGKGSSGGSESSEKGSKHGGKTRVDEFLGKLKDAMTSEAKDLKKVSVIYDHNRKRIIDHGKAKMKRLNSSKSEFKTKETDDEGKRMEKRNKKRIQSEKKAKK